MPQRCSERKSSQVKSRITPQIRVGNGGPVLHLQRVKEKHLPLGGIFLFLYEESSEEFSCWKVAEASLLRSLGPAGAPPLSALSHAFDVQRDHTGVLPIALARFHAGGPATTRDSIAVSGSIRGGGQDDRAWCRRVRSGRCSLARS